MNAKELMKKYEEHNLDEYKLSDGEDLYRVHGIDYKAVEGFSTLSKTNQEIFKHFIVNFFNSFGLGVRANLIPKRVLLVHNQWWWIEEEIEEGCINPIWIKEVHRAIDDDNRIIEAITVEIDEEYVEQLGGAYMDEKTYLRFEFYRDGKDEWVHIEKDGQAWG